MNSEEPEFEQPNLRAEFYGGRLDGWTAFFADAHPEFCPIVPVKDESGKILKRQVVTYRLDSHGPPLLYRFASAEDWTEPAGG
jgi:hypothetical protein